jgi:polyisoprenoid-binding protein YceI
MHFEVDINSIETGIGKRDRDMRDVLETNKWPTTYFDGTISSFTKIDSSVTAYRVTAKGTIFIHGKKREMEIPGTIAFEGDKMHVKTNFMVLLKDFDIEAPSLAAFVKVSQEIHLNLDFYLNEFKE